MNAPAEPLWRRLDGSTVYDAGVFRVRKDRYEYRGRRAGHPFHVLEAEPWVNVVAVTADRQILLVRQYRHGIQQPCLEIPGGVVDPTDADPRAGAARELLEETGYEAERWSLLCSVSSNPAILDNWTHTYLAEGAAKVADPSPDESEDIEVLLKSEQEVAGLLAAGEIHHSLCVGALGHYFLLRGYA